jgi:carboxypeptidase C (cathepsin A)
MMTSNYQKWNISAKTYWIILKFETEAYMTKQYFGNASNENDLQWKKTSKYLKKNISATT